MGIRLIEEKNLDGVMITPLKIIQVPGGDVSHGMKISDPGFAGFGEVYFSNIEPGVVKAWKRHRKMTLNLVVTVGLYVLLYLMIVINLRLKDVSGSGVVKRVLLSSDSSSHGMDGISRCFREYKHVA